eukprot:UN32700
MGAYPVESCPTNCVVCQSGVCSQCSPNYKLLGNNCVPTDVHVLLDFNWFDQNSVDYTFIAGGTTTINSLQNKISLGISGTTALKFDGTTQLNLNPINERIGEWTVSFWLKPNKLSASQTLMVMYDDQQSQVAKIDLGLATTVAPATPGTCGLSKSFEQCNWGYHLGNPVRLTANDGSTLSAEECHASCTSETGSTGQAACCRYETYTYSCIWYPVGTAVPTPYSKMYATQCAPEQANAETAEANSGEYTAAVILTMGAIKMESQLANPIKVEQQSNIIYCERSTSHHNRKWLYCRTSILAYRCNGVYS